MAAYFLMDAMPFVTKSASIDTPMEDKPTIIQEVLGRLGCRFEPPTAHTIAGQGRVDTWAKRWTVPSARGDVTT